MRLFAPLALLGFALALVACDPLEVVVRPAGGGGAAGAGVSTGPGAGGGTGSGFTPTTTGSTGGGGEGGEQPGPACGDGVRDFGEACDDGNGISGDGCSGDCLAVENGYACPFPNESCLLTVVCGDGIISGAETCDDANAVADDGCSALCQVEPGWACPDAGALCEAAECGDGMVAGNEQCDDSDALSPGCSATCQLEPGYKCDVPGEPCEETVCGDGIVEGTEQCDELDNDMGDGCTPLTCTLEPDCSGSPLLPCTTTCGDGIKLPNDPNEACEDGNTQSGDGCSASCQIEPGYVCESDTSVATSLALPIVLRDFSSAHPDMEHVIGAEQGIVAALLGADGKPVYANAAGTTTTTTGKANFDQWYRDVLDVNQTFLQTLTLGQLPSGAYRFNSSSFFPIDGQGFGNQGNGRNFHFTSEVRYWFEYKGGEQLDFTGDDDVWVFVNRHLAVDLGGVHGALSGSVTLGASQATSFQLTLGQVYEIVVFQAERHTTQSNYRLTLANFVNGKTVCESVCGDGIKTPDEACDNGVNDGSYGSCTPDCKKGPRCGDNIVQPQHEECDDGQNLTPYNGCAPGCKLGSTCGDGVVDSLFGEQCDDGVNDGGYGECAAACQLGARCGDGVVQADHEECDDGNKINTDTCTNACKTNVPN